MVTNGFLTVGQVGQHALPDPWIFFEPIQPRSTSIDLDRPRGFTILARSSHLAAKMLRTNLDEYVGIRWVYTAVHGSLRHAVLLIEKLEEPHLKSAHTALAVKACLLGGNSNTKCSMTFVNIAVAISALAGGGAQKRFRTETRPQKRFRTETRIRWCFRHFSRIFGCLSPRGYWNGILGHFGSFPAMEKRPKMKKTLYIARFCRVFGYQSIENTAKTSVLDWR